MSNVINVEDKVITKKIAEKIFVGTTQIKSQIKIVFLVRNRVTAKDCRSSSGNAHLRWGKPSLNVDERRKKFFFPVVNNSHSVNSIINVRVGNRNYNMLIDTGANVSLLLKFSH